jgi:hypothetical protein
LSTRVVFTWATWAIIAIFLECKRFSGEADGIDDERDDGVSIMEKILAIFKSVYSFQIASF